MRTPRLPLVSIVTPVYNGEQYLAECVESVLKQSYTHWEYLIVDNCSTDSTLTIARRYADLDNRIHVYHYDEFVSVIESYNRALHLISRDSKYCKVLCADDCIFPDCIARMVALAETNQSVGIVGAYALSGGGKDWRVKFDGLPYHSRVVSGREACRWHLLGGHHFLGVPTSVLYRSDLVRRTSCFFPNLREHADISAFYACLDSTDLGFVHEVLTYERVHGGALSAEAKRLSTYTGSHLLDIQQYGPVYLTPDELEKRLDEVLSDYYKLLATGVVNRQGKSFWVYHKAVLQECGLPLYGIRLVSAVCVKVIDLVLNPKHTFEKLLRRCRSYDRPQDEKVCLVGSNDMSTA